jgi:tRNA (cytidine/uridine-2'-O-)-methyltransferase
MFTKEDFQLAIHIVLVEPEIPQNTGNIARTCAATGSSLHLVGPLGFSIDDRYLKRAGLDYWNQVDIEYYENYDSFILKHGSGVFYYASTKAAKNYACVDYPEDCFIVFGKETKGLPESLLKSNYDHCLRIPMKDSIRSR